VTYDYVSTNDGLSRLVSSLRASGCTRLAIDVEGENNLHSYGIHVALIQLFDGMRGWIVDPLIIRDRALLAALLEDVPWTLVWFDAANDLLSFRHALDLRPRPILDLAVAARMLGMTGGLQSLTLAEESASAKDRFQKSNWMRRPISRAMLDYAITDVIHLLELADTLMAEIGKRNLGVQFQEKNLQQQDAERIWTPLSNFTRIPGFNRMKREDRHLARVLWYAREYYGRQKDLPPGNVASKQDMAQVISRGFRDPEGIARAVNEGRKKNLIEPAGFAAQWREAERDVARDEARAASVTSSESFPQGTHPQGARRSRGGR
jgi:ribonuclease D